MQWISLLMLTIGVALVQLPANTFSGKLEEDVIGNKEVKIKVISDQLIMKNLKIHTLITE